MSFKRLMGLFCASVVFCAVAPVTFGQDGSATSTKEPAAAESTAVKPAQSSATSNVNPTASDGVMSHALFVDIMAARGLKKPGSTTPNRALGNTRATAGMASKSAAFTSGAQSGETLISSDHGGGNQTLPLWTFRVKSSRETVIPTLELW